MLNAYRSNCTMVQVHSESVNQTEAVLPESRWAHMNLTHGAYVSYAEMSMLKLHINTCRLFVKLWALMITGLSFVSTVNVT